MVFNFRINGISLNNIFLFIFRYTILEDYSGAIITNYKEHSDGDKFRDALTQSLNQILDILKT